MSNIDKPDYYIGVMSGTSLDGIDVALIQFSQHRSSTNQCQLVDTLFTAYDDAFKQALLSLHVPSDNELEKMALVSNQLARLYAQSINTLLARQGFQTNQIKAIGCHGQTIRHRPELGFTLQISNNALLSELCDITVVGDFRSRDIAAGGQGAPLVPAFHQALFANKTKNRAIINIGGIANITFLPTTGEVIGFDSGPGNLLLDNWVKQHLNRDYDANGDWSSTGIVNKILLNNMLQDAFFAMLPPKSTGRDLFNSNWLAQHLLPFTNEQPQNIARTLVLLTATSIANALKKHCESVEEIYICGGGARNTLLIKELKELLPGTVIAKTDILGLDGDWVEATAFAWLAKQALDHKTGNLPAVTGAKGLRILGAIYPNLSPN